jgi:nicotinate phosphoribosyltransferase
MNASTLQALYKPSLALLTDLYQLTMAYGYWKAGMTQTEAVFHLFFRSLPFKGGYALAAGLADAIGLMQQLRFDQDDIAYLATLRGNDSQPLFEQGFLDYLANLEFACDVDAVPEGNVVFPHQPLLRISGPLIQAQLLETALLTIINFQTLIATKAARVVHAARGESVLEFGLRRAQGIDGGLSASRASYIGGASATSNVLAGRLYDLPVKGTHAHSWVMCFDTELEAFERYAEAMPNNCVFLVDTFDTEQGMRHAVEVGKRLRERGHELAGVRLDSGDLAYLSIRARKILDEGGFPNAAIVASNDLDEHVIDSLKQQGAQITVWGVGTKLSTAYDQPALGGVYKLSAVREPGGPWRDRIKISEQVIKVSNPGFLQTRRFFDGEAYVADMIYDTHHAVPEVPTIIDPMDMTRRKQLGASLERHDLLVPIFRRGALVYDLPTVHQSREVAQQELKKFHKGIKRFVNPHQYPVGLEASLFERKTQLILRARGFQGDA